MVEPSMQSIIETTAEVSNVDIENVPPAMRDAPPIPLGRFTIKSEPDMSSSILQDSGLGAQFGDHFMETHSTSTPVQASVYDRESVGCSNLQEMDVSQPCISRSLYVSAAGSQPGTINREIHEERFPVPMDDRQIAESVNSLLKQQRREQEQREEAEAEQARAQAERADKLLLFHRKRCIAQAERIASIPISPAAPTTPFGKGKGVGKRSQLD